jgi:hypothetical protein
MYCLFETNVDWNSVELKYIVIYYRRPEQINTHCLPIKFSMDTDNLPNLQGSLWAETNFMYVCLYMQCFIVQRLFYKIMFDHHSRATARANH